MLTFLGEIYLIFIVLIQLLYNVKNITKLTHNFPILDKEVYFQTLLILTWLFLLLLTLNAEAYSLGYFFVNNLGSEHLKMTIVFFALILLFLLFPIFSLQKLNFFEFFSFFLFSILSLLLIVSVHNLMSLYLAVEMQALCFYILATYTRNSAFSTEAGLKYFIASSFMSGFFLFGIFLIYCSLGTLSLSGIYSLLNFEFVIFNSDLKIVFVSGALLITSTLLFKIACAPFHLWAPDVYEGAPLSATVVFSVLPKIALVYLFFKWIFSLVFISLTINPFLLFCGVFSCFIGTFFSLYQKRIKRLIVYSSIAQIGFIVAGLSLNNFESFTSVFMFLIIYTITSILIWGHIIILYFSQFKINSFNTSMIEVLTISVFAGFFKKNKAWAFSILIIFFSIAGIPPFTGFFAKMVILFELISAKKWVVAIFLIFISSVSVFYYIRIVKMMFFEPKKLFVSKEEEFQIIFLNQDLQKIYFIFGLLLLSLITILLFPTNLYLFCQYIILKSGL